MVAKIFHDLYITQRHQFFMIYFFIWYAYTRMYGEFLLGIFFRTFLTIL